MPFGPYEDFDACVSENSDKNNPEAYCAAIKRDIEGEDSLTAEEARHAQEDPCEPGYTMVGTKTVNGQTVPNCVPDDGVPEPVGLSGPLNLTLRTLDATPLTRTQEDDDTVRYSHMKLLAPGVWTDAGSRTATYYSPEGIANISADYDDSEFDGPPVNIMHDVDMDTGDVNKSSIAGHVDPRSLDIDDDSNLYGDIVLDTSTSAGQYADENLQSALSSSGRFGFGGPSVELPAKGLVEEYDESRDMPVIKGALLSGLGLVMNPASKAVSFAREVARRGVALSGEGTKSFYLQEEVMDIESVRETLDEFGVDTESMDDEELLGMAENLHEELMAQLMPDDGMEMEEDMDEIPQEPAPSVDESLDEDNVEYLDEEHGDEMDDMDEMEEDMDEEMGMDEMMANLRQRLEDLEDMMAQAMMSEDAESMGKDLAAATSRVAELSKENEELSRRLEAIEDAEAPAKTLKSDGSEWADAESSFVYKGTGAFTR